MSNSKVNMSLDDIIKKNRSSYQGNRRGGRQNQSRGGNRNNSGNRGSFNNRSNFNNRRNNNYNRSSNDERPSTARTGARLSVSNLQKSINNSELRVN